MMSLVPTTVPECKPWLPALTTEALWSGTPGIFPEPMCKLDTRMIPGLGSNEVKRVRWSMDGSKIAAGCSSQQVLVYDFKGGSAQLFAQLPGHQECVFDVVWGVDGTPGTEYLVD